MSSAISPPGHSKGWWSRSKTAKDAAAPKIDRVFSGLADDDERSPASTHHGSSKHKDGLRFNTIASAMRFKSKKPPALAIQDPPSSVSSLHRPPTNSGRTTREPTPTTPSPFYTNRPPAASVTTVRSLEYDGDEMSDHPTSEPRTPSDHPRDRMSYQNSVLTMSEIDPFASGSVMIQHMPHDPTRLSVYSDSSLLDPLHQKVDMMQNSRISFTSSSSNSHGHMFDGQVKRTSSRLTQSSRYTSDSSVRGERRRHDSSSDRVPDIVAPPADAQRAHARIKSPTGSNSSCSTVTGDMRNRLSEPPNGARSPRVCLPPSSMRTRGMTVGNGKDSRPHTSDASGSSPSSTHPSVAPVTLRRQISASSFGATSPSSPTAPSPSPIEFARSTSTSSNTSLVSSSNRPLVLVRQASASIAHLSPPSLTPAEDLPPPPSSPFATSLFEDSLESFAMAFPQPPSSSSSSMSFVSSLDLDRVDSVGDAIMRHDFASDKTEKRRKEKGSHRHRHPRRTDSDLSPSTTVRDFEVEQDSGPSRHTLPPLSITNLADLSLDQSEYSHGSPQALKHVASQQSLLAKRYSAASQSSSTTSFSMGHEEGRAGSSSSTPVKSPRKQRSFHHSRLPLPPLPTLRHANSYNSGNPFDVQLPSPSQVAESRGSITNPSVPSSRKRLFSGSSIRRSTSSQAPNSPSTSVEDDMRSIISSEESRPTSSNGQKIVMAFGNFATNPLSLLTSNSCVAPSSFWNDAPSPPSSSQAENRVSQSEYTPQHIISPADMLKLEQQLADEAEEKARKPKLELKPGDFGFAFIGRRQRLDSRGSKSRTDSGLSDVSTGTLAFGTSSEERGVFGEVVMHGSGATSLAPQSPTSRQPPASPSKSKHLSAEASRLPLRSTSMFAKVSAKQATLAVRPSTSQPASTPPSPAYTAFSRSPDRPSITSLPPPPHSRDPHKRSSLVPLHALSPPPNRNKPRRPNTASSDSRAYESSAPPSAFETKATHRRSIMKKPSFLDIEDELDATTENLLDVDVDPPASPVMDTSFLDMDRGKESFDTLRSSESGFFV